MSHSALIRLIDGFDSVEKETSQKQLEASTKTKLLAQISDPIIKDAVNVLTSYGANLLKQECALVLSYFCLRDDETDGVFRVFHKDHPDKFRLVTVDRENLSISTAHAGKQFGTGSCADTFYAHSVTVTISLVRLSYLNPVGEKIILMTQQSEPPQMTHLAQWLQLQISL